MFADSPLLTLTSDKEQEHISRICKRHSSFNSYHARPNINDSKPNGGTFRVMWHRAPEKQNIINGCEAVKQRFSEQNAALCVRLLNSCRIYAWDRWRRRSSVSESKVCRLGGVKRGLCG